MSFVSSDFKQVIHNFCNVARTDFLYHTLNPSATTLERRLQAIWARTWNFSDPESAKDFVSSELIAIHTNVYAHYSTSLSSADTLDKIKNLAKSSFKQAPQAAVAICKKPIPTHANEVKDNLRTLWVETQKTLNDLTLETAKTLIETSLAKTLAPENIKKLYLEDLRLAHTLEGLKTRLQSYLNDLEVKGEGIASTSLGSQGYPKIIDVQRSERILGFMKTLGSSLEMDYHLLYSFFLNDCPEQEELCIQVPNASMLDLEKANYVDPRGKRYDISKYNALIKRLLGSVALLNTPSIRSLGIDEEIKFQRITETCPTGFFDLVNGLNLADFFREKYLSLNDEQKNRFCFYAGLITYLDLILGNQDRLIRLLPDTGEQGYSFFPPEENYIQESNLGNLMISHDFTKFYAIDNGIGDGRRDLSSMEEKTADEQAYTTFLEKNLRGRQDFKDIATNYLIQSLKPAIEAAFQETNYDAQSLKDVLSDISKEDRISFLRKGMDSMEDLLTERILPKWNHASAEPIKKALDEKFVQTIQTRLNLFAESKKEFKVIKIPASSVEDKELSECSVGSFDDFSSPSTELSGGRETPFSPVISGSKSMTITRIVSNLKDLASEIASQDTQSRFDILLSSLKNDFLLPQDIQLKITDIETSTNKDCLTALIKKLEDALISINPALASPRLSLLPSWDEEAEYTTGL